ncbi:MAG TPA: tRNA (adenosine(37)-N6)-threonylcarbamoyltransferase complex transferase subunit TsaD [Verrucomicrobiae bacterium]|nr:tRNA (adenosine(37)-N6)-threonylcarbamoyltransferase complex transferase subunit TsaD [Verrucomicrobiae bacterium]
MLLLAIETSCDETSAAVVRDGRTVLSNVISSQVATHAAYGGVVPEIASRKHLEAIIPVIEEAMSTAGVSFSDLQGVAVTRGPGLAGALLVGLQTAKAIAYAHRIPLSCVHHIEAHLFARFLETPVECPFLALAVSGGHTHLYRVDGFGRYRILGQTIDDAAGEAFDKVAKLLGMGYPGGALVDRLAAQGNPKAISFPRPLLHDGTLNFSFSGLKTSVMNHVRKLPALPQGEQLADLCASFQRAVCDVLAGKTEAALAAEGVKRLVVAGGVACNSGLRSAMGEMCGRLGVELHFPSPLLCTDNAAMVAVPAEWYLTSGMADPLSVDAEPTLPLRSRPYCTEKK